MTNSVSTIASNSTEFVMSIVVNLTGNVDLGQSSGPEALISTAQYMIFTKASLALWLFISCFGICSNILNIRTFIRMSPADSITMLFLALSTSDFLICLMSCVEATSTACDIAAWDFGFSWSMPPNIPRLYAFTIRRILSIVTILITVFLAIQRCLCVIMPLRIKGMFSPRLTLLFLLGAAIFAITPYSIYVAQYKVVSLTNPSTNGTIFKLGYSKARGSALSFVSIGLGVVFNVAAQVIINMCLIVMGFGLQKSVQFRKSATSSSAVDGYTEKPGKEQSSGVEKPTKDHSSGSSKERQALIQVAIVSIIFVVTNLPFLMITIARAIEPRIDMYREYRNFYVVLTRLMFIIEIINSSFNVFVYHKYNSKFKSLCFQSKNTK